MAEELNLDRYPFEVRPLDEDEGGGYLIEYPDIPGCMSDGETIDEAIANGRDALREVLLTLIETARHIPEPGTARKRAGSAIAEIDSRLQDIKRIVCGRP
jgi:antitoxin HicB